MEDPYFCCESTKFSRFARNNPFFSILMESIFGEYHISFNGGTSDYIKAEDIDNLELVLL